VAQISWENFSDVRVCHINSVIQEVKLRLCARAIQTHGNKKTEGMTIRKKLENVSWDLRFSGVLFEYLGLWVLSELSPAFWPIARGQIQPLQEYQSF